MSASRGVRAGIKAAPSWVWPLVAALVVIVSRLPFMGEMPLYWDTAFYFNAAGKAVTALGSSFGDFVAALKLCGHISYGYAIFLVAGRLLTPSSVVGVNVVNALLLAAALAALVRVVMCLVPKAPGWLVCALVSLIGFEPLLYGTFGSVNLDFPLLVFSALLLWAYDAEHPVLTGVFALLLATSKETGPAFLLGFVLCAMVIRMVAADRGGRVRALFHDRCLVACGIVLVGFVVVYLVSMVVTGGKSSWGGTSYLSASSSTKTINYFGLSIRYMAKMALQVFVFNFTWLFTLVDVIGLVWFLHGGRGLARLRSFAEGHVALMAFLVGATALVAFSFVYVTLPNPRYHMMPKAAIMLLAAIILLRYVTRRAVAAGVGAGLLACCLVESFVTVDPVTCLIYPEVTVGEQTYHPPVMTYRTGYPDTLAYNRQYVGRGHQVDELLDAVGYDDDTTLVVWETTHRTWMLTSLDAGTGDGKSMGLLWDSTSGTCVFPDGSATGVPITYESKQTFANALSEGRLDGRRVVLVVDHQFMSDADQDEALSVLGETYDVGDEVIVGDGCFSYYELTLR